MRPNIAVSSPYLIILLVAEYREWTFVWINRYADSKHPSGAPVFIEVEEESSVSVLTDCFLLDRKTNTNSWVLAGMLYSVNVYGCVAAWH